MKIHPVIRFALLLLLPLPAISQTATVTYDYEFNRMGENEPLPSETDFIISGALPETVNYVQVSIFSAKGKEDREPIATGNWKMPYEYGERRYHVPITTALAAGKKFDVQIEYFAPVDSAELATIYHTMATYLRSYLYQSFEIKKNKVVLRNSARQTYQEMNTLVTDGLRRYRSTTEPLFEGFSEIVRLKLEEADGAPTTYQYTRPTQDSLSQNIAIERRLPDVLEDLDLFVMSELKFALSKDLSERVDYRYLEDYPTEKRSGYFGVNVGYGAAFFGDEFSNNDQGLFLGLNYPLASSRIAPRFFQNASLGLGVFTNNFEDNQGRTVTGPVINRPFYLALEYKLIYFIRLGVGAAFLEREAADNGGTNAVLIRPFAGLSARINLSVSFDK